MKQLLITLLTLTAAPAFAGNGSGTMGIMLREAQGLDLTQTPVIRFERIVNGKEIELSQLLDVDGDKVILKQITVKPKNLSPLWEEALKRSSATKGWQLIDENEQLELILSNEN